MEDLISGVPKHFPKDAAPIQSAGRNNIWIRDFSKPEAGWPEARELPKVPKPEGEARRDAMMLRSD